VSDVEKPRDSKASAFGPALAGGVVGAVLTAALLLFAAPQLVGGQIVRHALMADPQILVDSADALRDRQYEPALKAQRAALEKPFNSSWKGSANPDVVLVEFFDYACGYCRASLPHIERLLREDKGLRVVFRELPILGPESVAAARLSLAASKAGRFNQFHDTLYAAGRPGAETIAAATQAAGINAPVASTADAEAELKSNFQLAGALGATGTPLFIVGDKVMNSAVGYDALKKAIADARAKGSSS
jgi:protein-disulfide isomerase